MILKQSKYINGNEVYYDSDSSNQLFLLPFPHADSSSFQFPFSKCAIIDAPFYIIDERNFIDKNNSFARQLRWLSRASLNIGASFYVKHDILCLNKYKLLYYSQLNHEYILSF